MTVFCNANAIIEYDSRRKLGIPSAPLDRIYDNISYRHIHREMR